MTARIKQLLTLGRQHYKADQFEKAEQYLSQVVREHSNFADVLNMLGVIYHTQGRLEESQAMLEKALLINPKYTEAALNLAVTYNARGKYDKAREIYRSAIIVAERSPGRVDPFARGKIANMHAEIGAVYASIGLHDDAVREYCRALDMGPDFVDIRAQLAGVYREMGMINAAIREYELIKSERPDYLPARICLGITFFSVGRKAEAITEWEGVMIQDPANRGAASYLRIVRDGIGGVRSGSAILANHER